MRLIDADAFDKCLEDAEDEAIHMQKYVFASALNTIRGNLRTFPTIEPEQKTGHWEIYTISMLDGEDVRCPKCGQRGCAPYWEYCPNCGEKKEGVQYGSD